MLVDNSVDILDLEIDGIRKIVYPVVNESHVFLVLGNHVLFPLSACLFLAAPASGINCYSRRGQLLLLQFVISLFLCRDFLVGRKDHHVVVITAVVIIVVAGYRSNTIGSIGPLVFPSFFIRIAVQHCQQLSTRSATVELLGIVFVASVVTVAFALVRLCFVHNISPGCGTLLAEKGLQAVSVVVFSIPHERLVIRGHPGWFGSIRELVAVLRIHKGSPHDPEGMRVDTFRSGLVVVDAKALLDKCVRVSIVFHDPASLQLGVGFEHFFFRPPRGISHRFDQSGVYQLGLVLFPAAPPLSATATGCIPTGGFIA
mmetsp:Transcript_25007/g.53280  ORF Transcript_25007/g.53280 Transcript_25007/m.53280 type:complete len:314 (-) Transcript_25007:115-1056(-)